MKAHRIFVVFAGILLVAAAGEPYRVDWSSLEEAWTAYLAQPSAERAAHIQELLPPDRTVSHRSEDFNVTVATRILDRLGILESLLAEGRYHAFEVAFALGEISDGEYAEWLSEMLGASARTHPTALLKSMKSNRIRLSDSCRFGVAADPDKFDTPAKYIVEIEARRESVAGISDADLAVPRECLCMEFDRVLERR